VIVGTRDRKAYIVDRLRSHIKDYPWQVHVYNAQELQIGGYHRRAFSFPEVAIDDAEYVFSVLFGTRLEFMSMNATYIPLGPAQPDTIKADATIVPEIAARDQAQLQLELERHLDRPHFRGLEF
jgi:hypothetical protein